MATETITFKQLTGERFTEQNLGQNYGLPLLRSGLCKYRVRAEDGDLIGKCSSATNTSVTHDFEAGEAMTVVIKEHKGDNTLILEVDAPEESGTVKWTLITEARGMSLNIKTI